MKSVGTIDSKGESAGVLPARRPIDSKGERASVLAAGARTAAVMIAWASLFGCSSSGATPSPGGSADGGLDATSPPSDGAAPPPADANGMNNPDTGTKQTTCTQAPFFAFAGTLTALSASGAMQPLAGGRIGFSTCPGYWITTDASGKASTQITQNNPLSPIYSGGASYLSAIGAEIPATGDVTLAATIFGLDVAPAIPGFQADGGEAPTIAITLASDPAATAPCNDTTGVTLTVTGHPEAVVSYANPAWPATPAVATTSSTGPYVFLNGIQGATKVVVTGTKTGCTVKLATANQTGNFLLVASSVTVGAATITN